MKRLVRILKRSVNAASSIGFTFIALALAWLNIWVHNQTSPTYSIPAAVVLAAWAIFVVAIVFWLVQASSEYNRRIHDPTWILKYQEIWDNSARQRRVAAKALIDSREHLSDVDCMQGLTSVDDVLDILEDVGFYAEADQISREVAHHHLYHWIRGYWFAAQPYIMAKRQEEGTWWEHVRILYEETSEIEAKKRNMKLVALALSDNKVTEFLKEELEAGTAELDGVCGLPETAGD
jgi:hypothetical protein